jgi:hypothetical protein
MRGPLLAGVLKVGILGRQAVGVGGITFPERQVARGSYFCALHSQLLIHAHDPNGWLGMRASAEQGESARMTERERTSQREEQTTDCGLRAAGRGY